MQDTAEPVETSIYRYYDVNGLLIYVGITSRGVARNREHNSSKEWWPFVARQEVEHVSTRPEALRREADLIRRHFPPFNKQHNPIYGDARATYLAYATGTEPALTASERQALRRRLPLVPVRSLDDGHEVWLRSLPQHHAVVGEVLAQKGEPGTVVSTLTRKHAGTVFSVDHLGKMLVVRVRGKFLPDPLERAQATLRVIQQKPLAWRIDKVFVHAPGERDV